MIIHTHATSSFLTDSRGSSIDIAEIFEPKAASVLKENVCAPSVEPNTCITFPLDRGIGTGALDDTGRAGGGGGAGEEADSTDDCCC